MTLSRELVEKHCSFELLESLHPDEAEIICLCKDKDLGSKYRITHNVVKEAYPDVEWGNRR